jgi:hypothetical protein
VSWGAESSRPAMASRLLILLATLALIFVAAAGQGIFLFLSFFKIIFKSDIGFFYFKTNTFDRAYKHDATK